MRNPRQHHLHALVARPQRGPHLVQASRQIANLVPGLDRHRAGQIAAPNPFRGARQTGQRSGHPARKPRRQHRDEDRAHATARRQPATKPGQLSEILRAALHDNESRRFPSAHPGIATLIGSAIASPKQGRTCQSAGGGPLDLGLVSAQLVGVRAQGHQPLSVASPGQIAGDQQNPPDTQSLPSQFDAPVEIGVGIGLLVADPDGRELLGQRSAWRCRTRPWRAAGPARPPARAVPPHAPARRTAPAQPPRATARPPTLWREVLPWGPG